MRNGSNGKRYGSNGQRQRQIVPFVLVCKHGRRDYQHAHPQLPAPPAAATPPQTLAMTIDLHITHYNQRHGQRQHYHHQRIVQSLHGCTLRQRRIRPPYKTVHRKGDKTHRKPPAAEPLLPFLHMQNAFTLSPQFRPRPMAYPYPRQSRPLPPASSGGRCGAGHRR